MSGGSIVGDVRPGRGRTVVVLVATVAMVLAMMVGAGAGQAWAAGCGKFSDVPASDPSCADLKDLTTNGVIAGATKFRPHAAVTRAELAQFLYGLAHPGTTAPKCTAKPYKDVKKSAKNCGAIAWAKKATAIPGHGKKAFKPAGTVNRKVVALSLFAVAKPGKSAPKCTAKPFTDVAKKGEQCRAIAWVADTGIVEAGGTFGVKKKVKRLALATMMNRTYDAMRAGGPTLPKAPTTLVGTFFEGAAIVDYTNSSKNYFGVMFIDKTWAYWGRPDTGIPTCTKKAAKPEPGKPQNGWGCIKYSYTAKNGVIKLGGLSGKYRADGTVKIDGRVLTPAVFPQAGTRLNADLMHQGYSGMCPLFCSTWKYRLVFGTNGTFLRTKSSVSSLTGGGSFTWGGNFPPDQYGTYTIKSKGRIALKFADGSSETMTIAVMLGKNGKPNINGDAGDGGLILGTDDYYRTDE